MKLKWLLGIVMLVLAPTCCGAQQQASPQPAQTPTAPAIVNLCQLPGVKISGNMGADSSTFDGKRELDRIQIKPYTLIVTWPSPVTFNTNAIDWASAGMGIDYGLEYWDAAAGCYVLVYEETMNTKTQAVHSFASITTSKIRFTVFTTKVSYMALGIKGFQIENIPASK